MNAWETVFSAWMPDPGGDLAYQTAMKSVVREEAELLRREGPSLSLDELSDAYARREDAALRFAFRSGFLLGVRLMAESAT
ncbi:hypothetical protein [uncultured Oscillibacter sp.]|uniref:hypothetical protein n=1 Tax=uncultured Oscillibacter sp. TaxID=876091 RepID=UPI002804064E|nr:hypothetical protein [uncultured Oscillibacter sp.]